MQGGRLGTANLRPRVSWLHIAGFVALGFFVGGYGTMVGAGGGFLLVPLFLIGHMAPKDAAGTSLAVILANAASGTASYVRQKRVDVRTGLLFSLAGLPGAILGAYIDQVIPHRVFNVLFALLLAGLALRLLFGADPEPKPPVTETEPRPPGGGVRPKRGTFAPDFVDARGVRHAYQYDASVAIGLSFGVGFLGSIFGIGGAVVFVPAMVFLFGFPAHVATATSQFIILLTSLFATASHAYYGDVMWLPAVTLGVGAVGGAQVGAQLAKRIAPRPLLRLLSIAQLTAAGWLIYQAAA